MVVKIRNFLAACEMAALVAVAVLPRPAAANPLDIFGAGSRQIAMGGTGTAIADSYEAAYYNPAALGLMEHLESGIGVSVYRPWLTAKFNSYDKATQTITPVSARRFDRAQVYLDGGAALPIPLGKNLGRHLFLGLHLMSPADALYSLEALPSTEPTFPLYENRNRRLVLAAALAGRYEWLMFGVGVSLLPSVGGAVRVDLGSGDQQNYLGVDVGYRVSANVGLLFEPIKGLTLGFSWRGANHAAIELPVDASVSSTINPIYMTVTALAFWTPHEFSFGAGWKADNYAVSADVVYYMFSDFKISSPEVAVYSDGERENQTSSSTVPDAGLRDSVSVRLGAEYRPHKAVGLRAGFGWSQSPLSIQSGDTNLLGGDQYSGSFGIGFDAEKIGGPQIKVDAHFMAAAVIDNTDAKLAVMPGNPGYPSIGGGGWFLNSGVSVRFGF